MSVGIILVEVIGLFLVVAYLLHQYSDLRKQNLLVLIAVFISWYFSFMIVVLLPLDISLVRNVYLLFLITPFIFNIFHNNSQTTYRQCIKDHGSSEIPAPQPSNNTVSYYIHIFCISLFVAEMLNYF
jgi:hypothetical protein